MDRTANWRGISRAAGIAALVSIGGAGLVVADTLTRPLDVHLQTRIEILRQTEEGRWAAIDRVAPAEVRFEASLVDVARGHHEIGSAFALRAKTVQGRDYAVRLAAPAEMRLNPATGRIDGRMALEVTLDGRSARVIANPTTEAVSGPLGTVRGRRAEGVPGREPTAFTVVSANELLLPGEPPMMLVTEERYRLVPAGRR